MPGDPDNGDPGPDHDPDDPPGVPWWNDPYDPNDDQPFLPQGPSHPPSGQEPSTPGGEGSSGSAGSQDPNEKIGPGFGPEGWVKADALLPYRIHFENLGPGSKDENGDPYPTFATAPAQRVTITDQLEAALDWESFQITDFGWGDTIINVPVGTSHYTGSTNMTYNGKTFAVEIEAGIDFTAGRIFVRFQSMDPESGLPPDVLTGFLPPEDGTGRGMGHFAYTIRSKANLPLGTKIRNVALIRFDNNEIIATNQVDAQDPTKGTDPNKEALITLDLAPPTSQMQPLPPLSGTSFTVNWNGSDAESGVRQYHLLVSENGGPFQRWITTAATSAVFDGTVGNSYGFVCLAEDYAGHVEPKAATAETTTSVSRLPAATLRVAMPFTFAFSSEMRIVSITGLPPGLAFNKTTGTIQGKATRAGTYVVTVTLRNDLGQTAKEKFTMVVNALPEQAQGSFIALMDRNAVIGNGLGGSLAFKSTSSGAVTGSLTLAGKRHVFTGRLTVLSDTVVSLQTTISRGRSLTALGLQLNLAPNHTLTGHVSDVTAQAPVNGWRSIWRIKTKTRPATEPGAVQLGRTNLLLDLNGAPWASDPQIPQGLGYGTFTLSKLGVLTYSGKMPDGAAVTRTTTFGPGGEVAVWIPLYTNTGSATLRAVLNANGELTGTGDWVRLPQKLTEKLYREGFGHAATATLPAGPVPIVMAGKRWIAPVKQPILQLPYDPLAPASNAVLSTSSGGLGIDTVTLTPDLALRITDRNLVIVEEPNPAKAKMTVTASTGRFSGSLLLQDVNTSGKTVKRTVNFYGYAVPGLDDDLLGGGYFLLPQLADPTRTLSGRVELIKPGL